MVKNWTLKTPETWSFLRADKHADFEVELKEMDGEVDHVHLLVNYPPKVAVSALVNSLKGASSRVLRKERPDIAARFYYKGGAVVSILLCVELLRGTDRDH